LQRRTEEPEPIAFTQDRAHAVQGAPVGKELKGATSFSGSRNQPSRFRPFQ
jgi:hypothetical protein